MLNWKTIIRDVIAVRVLDYLINMFVLYKAYANGQLSLVYYGFLNVLFLVICFTIIGCITRTNRFRHLFLVAFGYLITGAYLLLVPKATLSLWINFGNIIMLVFSVISGWLLSIFLTKIKRQFDNKELLQNTESLQYSENQIEIPINNDKHIISTEERKNIDKLIHSLDEIKGSIDNALAQGRPQNDLSGSVLMVGLRVLIDKKIVNSFNSCLDKSKVLFLQSRLIQQLEPLTLALPDTIDVYDYPLVVQHLRTAEKVLHQLRRGLERL
jgi:hypothetical protein